MNAMKPICGVVLLLLGYIYLYKPKLVMKINFYAKEFLFNDVFVLLHRRKIGALFVLLAIIATYMAWTAITK